jgi:hypothetical protein
MALLLTVALIGAALIALPEKKSSTQTNLVSEKESDKK